MTDVSQIAYATRDIEQTALAMARVDAVGPFYFADFPLCDLQYRGKVPTFDHIRVAFSYRRNQQIELLQTPAGDGAIYGEGLGGRREVFHHTYHSSDEDYDAIIARHAAAGEAAIYQGVALSGEERVRFAYLDARPRLGHFVEVLETAKMVGAAAYLFEVYARMEAISRDWNGERPIRELSELF